MINAAIYTRVSTKDQVNKGFSLDAQEKIGKDLCDRNKWQYNLFVESGRSASKETIDNRPALKKILDLAEDGQIQFLFVTELDRLSRNIITLAGIKKILSDNDVKVVTPSQTFDFKDDNDDFISDLFGLLGKRENRDRVRRSKRAKTEAVKLGRWVGSTLPYGWMKQPCEGDRLKHNQLVPHPEESKIYLKMVDWSMKGLGSNSIALKLNELNISTRFTQVSKQGKSFIWKAGTVLRILKNPIYKGIYKYGEGIAQIDGIISPEEWQELQDHLKGNYNNAPRNTKRFYLLRGLLICKRCGKRLYGLIKPSREMRAYCCLSKRPDPDPRFCGLKNVSLDSINDYVWDTVKKLVTDSSAIKQAVQSKQKESGNSESGIKDDVIKIDKQISDLNSQSERLIELYTRNSIAPEDLDFKAKDFNKRKEALKIQKAALLKTLVGEEQRKQELNYLENYLKDIRKRINNFTDQEKYELLHLLIEKIVVDYDSEKNIHTFDIEFLMPVEAENKPLGSRSPDSNSRREKRSVAPLSVCANVSDVALAQTDALRFSIQGQIHSRHIQ